MVNGFGEGTVEMRWSMGNSSLSFMKESLDKFMSSKDDFDQQVKLWSDTLTSLVANSSSNKGAAEFPQAASQLREDVLDAFGSYVYHFEQSFNALPMTQL